MKKRKIQFLVIIIVVALLTAFDLYIRLAWGVNLNYYERMLITTGIPLLIVSAIVAYYDELNLRLRREDPIDYITVKGFRVKERLCTMGEENLAVLTLYNQSKRAATVTVTVTYLNVAGRVLGTEKQTVHGMVRGMEKHMCFRPGRNFHSFTYTLETSFYRGICHERAYCAECFRTTTPLPVMSPHEGSCPIDLEITEEYTGTAAVEVVCSYLLLDKEDTVRGLYHAETRTLTAPQDPRTVTAAAFEIHTEGNIPLGEELGGIGLTGLCVYSVTPIQ